MNATISLIPTLLAAGMAVSGKLAGSPPTGQDLVRSAAAGDPSAFAAIEARLAPLFDKKDLAGLSEAVASREAIQLLGVEAAPPAVLWSQFHDPGHGTSLLAIDFSGSSWKPLLNAGSYVLYAIVEELPGSSSKRPASAVAWYHDCGRKLTEQGGEPWHPRSALALGGGAGQERRSIVVSESQRPGAPPSGLLVFDSEQGGGWSASRRISPASAGLAGAHLVAVGEGGGVFFVPREPPKGVLTGAPADLFRSAVLFERRAGAFADEPVIAPLPDPVTAAEALLASVRRGDKQAAAGLCRSPDVLESMLYFSPGWTGGGRIVGVSGLKVEFQYAEQGRPPLRIEFAFTNDAGRLLLSAVTGRQEEGAKP